MADSDSDNSQPQDLGQASQRSFHFAQRMPDEEEYRDGGVYAGMSGYGGNSQSATQDGEAGDEDGYAEGDAEEDGYAGANGEDGYGDADGEEDGSSFAPSALGAPTYGEDGYGANGSAGEDGYAGANGEGAGANGEGAGANGEGGYAEEDGEGAGANGEESDDEEFTNMPVPRRAEPAAAGSALDEEDGVSPEPRTPYYFAFAQSSQPRSNEYPDPSQRIEFTPSDGVVGGSALSASSAASMNPPSAASGRLARGDAAAAAADGAALSPRSRLRRSFAQRLVETERAERREQEDGEGEDGEGEVAEEEERGARPSRRSRIPPGESKDEGESDEEEKDDYNSEAKRARR
jgi:hypothetical protein